MRRLRVHAGESDVLYPAIGLRLVDDFTGGRPLTPVGASLEQLGDDGAWRVVRRRPVYTPDGVLAFRNLQRSSTGDSVASRFRVKLDPHRLYDPAYRRRVNGHDREGLEFTVFSHGAGTPPLLSPLAAERDDDARVLLPSVAYPFPKQVPVVRGVVRDAASGEPLERAKVSWSNMQDVLNRAEGFALPVRRPPQPTTLTQAANPGDTRLHVERGEGFGLVRAVEIVISSTIRHVREISNLSPDHLEFDISAPVPAGPAWAQGKAVNPLGFLIDAFYQARHATYEVPLPDGFDTAHEILL